MANTVDWSSTLACRFIAELLERTIDIMDDAAHQRAVQAFVDELRPWMSPVKSPVRSHAPLFSSLEVDEKSGQVTVHFTPQGLSCFHGWLRRRGLSPHMGTS